MCNSHLYFHSTYKISCVICTTDADESDVDDWTELDKVDEWNWKDGAVERPEQSRRVVNDVIKEATEGNMGRFYDHFLRGFVVPDNDDGTVGDTEVPLFDLILRSCSYSQCRIISLTFSWQWTSSRS